MFGDIRLAIIVNPELPPGLIANTVAAISVGIGAAIPALGGKQLTDRLDRKINISSNQPIPILQADGGVIQSLLLKALAEKSPRAIVPFPAFARALHNYSDYERTFPERDLAGEVIDGLGIAGPVRWVRSLTGSLRLLK